MSAPAPPPAAAPTPFSLKHLCGSCKTDVDLTPDNVILNKVAAMMYRCVPCGDKYRLWTSYKKAPEPVRDWFAEQYRATEPERLAIIRKRTAKIAETRARKSGKVPAPSSGPEPRTVRAEETGDDGGESEELDVTPVQMGRGAIEPPPQRARAREPPVPPEEPESETAQARDEDMTELDQLPFTVEEIRALRAAKGTDAWDLIVNLKRREQALKAIAEQRTGPAAVVAGAGPFEPVPGFAGVGQGMLGMLPPEFRPLLAMAQQRMAMQMLGEMMRSFSGAPAQQSGDMLNMDKLFEQALKKSMLDSITRNNQPPVIPQQQPSLQDLLALVDRSRSQQTDPWPHVITLLTTMLKDRGPPPGMTVEQVENLVTKLVNQGPRTDTLSEVVKALATWNAGQSRPDPSAQMLQTVLTSVLAKKDDVNPMAYFDRMAQLERESREWRDRALMEQVERAVQHSGGGGFGNLNSLVMKAMEESLAQKLTGQGAVDQSLSGQFQKILNSPLGEAFGAGALMWLNKAMSQPPAPQASMPSFMSGALPGGHQPVMGPGGFGNGGFPPPQFSPPQFSPAPSSMMQPPQAPPPSFPPAPPPRAAQRPRQHVHPPPPPSPRPQTEPVVTLVEKPPSPPPMPEAPVAPSDAPSEPTRRGSLGIGAVDERGIDWVP